MAKQKITGSVEALAKVVVADDLALNNQDRSAVSSLAFAQCIRVLRQNWRQGTVGCKGRADVSFSNKKPWKQKGTGRARAGSARSPLWRGGGIIFGPQARTRTLDVTKTTKQQVFRSLLWKYLDAKNVFSLQWNPVETGPKTAIAFDALKQAGLNGKKIVMFVSAHDFNTHASFSNLPNVQMLLFDQPNAYHLSDGHCWVFLNKDAEAFKGMVSSWI